jgi:hypothetical protein
MRHQRYSPFVSFAEKPISSVLHPQVLRGRKFRPKKSTSRACYIVNTSTPSHQVFMHIRYGKLDDGQTIHALFCMSAPGRHGLKILQNSGPLASFIYILHPFWLRMFDNISLAPLKDVLVPWSNPGLYVAVQAFRIRTLPIFAVGDP